MTQNSSPEYPASFELPDNVEGQVEGQGGSEGGYIIEQCGENVVTNSLKYKRFYKIYLDPTYLLFGLARLGYSQSDH